MPIADTPFAQRRSERGIVAIIVALLALVILGIVALGLDSNHIGAAAQQLQAAADSAALGAASRLKDESTALGGSYPNTRAAAVSLASQNTVTGSAVMISPNTGNAADGDVVVGTWDSATAAFTPTTVSPNAVKVVARRTTGSTDGPLSTVFGAALGSPTAEVARTSIASFKAPSNPVIIVLDPSANGALSLGGNATINAAGGRVQVNSGNSCGIKLNGSAQLSADQVAVVGHACYGGSSAIGNLKEGADVMADPLAALLPSTADWNAQCNSMPKPAGATGAITAGGSFAPGYYPKGLSISSNTTITLTAGVYMFGTQFSVGGGTVLNGTNVTILLDKDVKLALGGGASIVLTPPLSGTFQGVAIMCHRGTSATNALDFGGNGVVSIEGTLYAPAGGVAFSGTSGVQSFGQVICDRLDQSGNSRITGLHIVPSHLTGGGVTLVH